MTSNAAGAPGDGASQVTQANRVRHAGDRRSRRRAETQAQILDIALEVMAEEGVAGLSLAAVARRLGIQPPSLYKYFASRHAVYDALFRRGQERYRDTIRCATEGGEPGLAALGAAFDAGGRWIMRNQVLAQLLFWRPVPGFVPSVRAMTPAIETKEHYAALVRSAVDRGQLHADAAGDEGLDLASSLIAGVISQQLSNEPDARFEEGRFTRHMARLPALFTAAYPPAAPPST